MKTINKTTIVLINILFLTTFLAKAQDKVSQSPPFEVQKVYPYISITKAQLAAANSLADLKTKSNKLDLEYKPSWVSRYISVEIQVCQDGELITAIGKTDILTEEQKDLLSKADSEKEIQVKINYWPKNNLVLNDSKTIDFSFSLDPENTAAFPKGEEALYEYLDKTVISKISSTTFENYEMTAIKFSINTAGKIHDAEIFRGEYQDEKFATINQQLIEAIRKMPNWQPAKYSDGTLADQAFVLTVGNSENCFLPLLNVGR